MELDHLVIFVPSLAQGIAHFKALGFEVIEGGQHDATENALIVFQDHTYIELLALKRDRTRPLIRMAAALGLIKTISRRKRDVSWRLLKWVSQGYGSIDWCIRVGDVDAVLAKWANADAPGLGSRSFSRKRTDGALAEWRLGSLKNNDLPLLLSDLTRMHQRLPSPPRQHANGATGIRKLWVATQDQQHATTQFDRCFDRIQTGVDSNPVYTISEHQLELVGRNHHSGKCALALTYSGDKTLTLDPEKTFGMSISLVPA